MSSTDNVEGFRVVAKMTPSQRGAFETIVRRYPRETFTSSRNGPSYVASGSAARLVDLGFAQWVASRFAFDRLLPTERGLELGRALGIEQEPDDQVDDDPTPIHPIPRRTFG